MYKRGISLQLLPSQQARNSTKATRPPNSNLAHLKFSKLFNYI